MAQNTRERILRKKWVVWKLKGLKRFLVYRLGKGVKRFLIYRLSRFADLDITPFSHQGDIGLMVSIEGSLSSVPYLLMTVQYPPLRKSILIDKDNWYLLVPEIKMCGCKKHHTDSMEVNWKSQVGGDLQAKICKGKSV